jgi:hypothetical protein
MSGERIRPGSPAQGDRRAEAEGLAESLISPSAGSYPSGRPSPTPNLCRQNQVTPPSLLRRLRFSTSPSQAGQVATAEASGLATTSRPFTTAFRMIRHLDRDVHTLYQVSKAESVPKPLQPHPPHLHGWDAEHNHRAGGERIWYSGGPPSIPRAGLGANWRFQVSARVVRPGNCPALAATSIF